MYTSAVHLFVSSSDNIKTRFDILSLYFHLLVDSLNQLMIFFRLFTSCSFEEISDDAFLKLKHLEYL